MCVWEGVYVCVCVHVCVCVGGCVVCGVCACVCGRVCGVWCVCVSPVTVLTFPEASTVFCSFFAACFLVTYNLKYTHNNIM